MEGSLPPTSYNVVLPDQTYCGEIKVGLTFTIKEEEDCGEEAATEEVGGWKESSHLCYQKRDGSFRFQKKRYTKRHGTENGVLYGRFRFSVQETVFPETNTVF